VPFARASKKPATSRARTWRSTTAGPSRSIACRSWRPIWCAGRSTTALAAKGATTTIPIVFSVSEDPVKFGLVPSLARPGGNLTGINLLGLELTAKRLELLREMLPAAARVAVLVNPANTANAQITLREVEAAGRAMGLQLPIFNASTSREIDAAFAAFGRERPDAVFVGQDAFFNGRRLQLANWAARHALP
jgi:putative ABC transport system substrate-binding protein